MEKCSREKHKKKIFWASGWENYEVSSNGFSKVRVNILDTKALKKLDFLPRPFKKYVLTGLKVEAMPESTQNLRFNIR